jgi:hypothetical protein
VIYDDYPEEEKEEKDDDKIQYGTVAFQDYLQSLLQNLILVPD